MSNRTYSASWIRKLTSRMGRPVPAAPASSSLSDDTLRIWEAAESLPMSDFFESRLKDLVAVCKRELPDVDEAMIRTAYALAHWAHRDDLRKSGEPYLEHPVEVAFIVARDIHFDDTCVAAALLHDVVEDNRQITVDHIRELFGDTLAKIVDGVTKMEREFESREVRQAENFRKLLLSMATDIRVILVKFGDRLHNMRTISVLPERKRYKIATETQALFAPLAHRFGLYSIKNELEDLCLKVLDPDKYHKIANALAAKKTERELYVKSFIGPLRRKLKKNKFDFEIYGRSKHIYSIYRKMRRQNKEIDEIYDLFAIRIIINSEGRRGKEDCWRVYSIITDLYRPLPERFRDFVSTPKSNGYQSLHTTVIGPDGKRVEVQIRTREMHLVAEMGVAAHWKYKEGANTTDQLTERYAWVRDLLERPDSDEAAEFMSDLQSELVEQEVYVFTPRGDLMTLPKGSTPVDFAFRVHSEVGFHCSGARVNGRAVQLSYQLQSGDQVEIQTTKNKTPNAAWMKFVVTQKAKSRIRHWINEERREATQKGRDLWRKASQKLPEISDRDLNRIAARLGFPNTQQLFYEIGKGIYDVKNLVQFVRGDHPQQAQTSEPATDKSEIREKFVQQSQASGEDALLIEGERLDGMKVTYASCCAPKPGDRVFGFLSRNGGLTVHRRSCKNAPSLYRDADRVVEVDWGQGQNAFISGIKVIGEDRVGLVNDLTNAISNELNTNIRSLSIETVDGVFEGVIVLDIDHLDHLDVLMARLRRINGVYGVHRFEE